MTMLLFFQYQLLFLRIQFAQELACNAALQILQVPMLIVTVMSIQTGLDQARVARLR